MPFDAQAPAEVTARDRMIQLRDFLEMLPPERFRMASFASGGDDRDPLPERLSGCGTTGCIAGWTCFVFGLPVRSSSDLIVEHAREALGLDEKQGWELFYPDGYGRSDKAPAAAVAVLDHYLTTGKIDWSVA